MGLRTVKASVVVPERLAAPDDVAALIDLVRDALDRSDTPELAAATAAEMRRRFDIARLVAEIVALYERYE